MQIDEILEDSNRKDEQVRAIFNKQMDILDKTARPMPMFGMFVLGGLAVASMVWMLAI